jgi:hypothetical protein
VEASGFRKYAQTHIPLAVQQQATLDVSLQVGDLTTSVEVQSTAPLLNTTIATLGQVIENRFMQGLPNIGRNALNYLTLTPGVVGANSQGNSPTNTNFVANGARNSTSDVLIDGAIANTTEQNTGTTDLKYTPAVDAVQEFKMQVNFFGAEYAQSGSAVVNLVTKSGTNEFHGDAFSSLTLLDPMYWGLGRTALQAAVPNPFYGAITDPKANNLKNQTIQYFRLLRNMPQFDGASGSELGNADSSYHAFQIKWEKRYSRGLQVLAHYTFAKMMDDVSNGSSNLDWLSNTNGRNLQNLFNYAQERSLSSNDVRHRLVALAVYDIPFGRGRSFGGGVNRWVDSVIGGWQMSGVYTHQSSQPLQVTQNGGTLWSGTQRPNLVGDPATSGSVYDRFNNWFNVSAFSQPAADVFGSAPRFLGVRGPRLHTFDAALGKSWKTTERQRLEFRAEASNILNHSVFNPPGRPSARAASDRLRARRSIREMSSSV